MARKNPPPRKIPSPLIRDKILYPYFKQLTDAIYQMWLTAGGAPWLATYTADNSATIDIVGILDNKYDVYVVRLDLVAATDGADLQMLVGTGATPTYDTGANYSVSSWWADSADSALTFESSQTASNMIIAKSVGSDTGEVVAAEITINNPSSTANYKPISSTSTFINADGNSTQQHSSCANKNNTSAITAIRFKFSTGNIESGNIRIYGIKK